MSSTLYDVLEVIPTASAETIHAAYRSLVLRYHPDKVAALGPELQAVANARTKEINFAYDILSDEASRARYDEELRDGEEHLPLLPPDPPSDPDNAGFAEPGSPGYPEPRSEPRFSELAYPRPVSREPAFLRPQEPVEKGPGARGSAVGGPAVRGSAERGREQPATGRPAGAPSPGRHPLATLAATIAGVALILILPLVANVIFGAVEFSLTGHARFFYEDENPVDAKGNFGSAYLPVLWGWLFANYLFGLVSYRLAVLTGETAAAQLGGSFAATNDRLFLFLTFVCVVAVGELLFSAHTMGTVLAGMFMLAGAYLAERGIT
jgi:hypothetical protein